MPRFHRIPERAAPTLRQALSLVWWASDVQRYPSWSWWAWFKRNPCSNAFSTIIGVAHLPRDFVSRDRATIWADAGRHRLAWTLPVWAWGDPLHSLRRWFVPRPLWSFPTTSHEAAAGWKVDGSFSITWRRLHAEEARP